MRKITNWTDDQIEEFNNLASHGLDAFGIIGIIMHDSSIGSALYEKHVSASDEEENEFAQDIVDLLADKAEFPQNLYYVKFIDSNEGSYLNRSHQSSELHTDIKDVSDSIYQTEFTMKEINDIDPKYKEFAVPVN